MYIYTNFGAFITKWTIGWYAAALQGFAESLQHYTKMHKAKSADRSIYGAQAGLEFVLLITLPAANYNLSLLKRLNLGL